MITPKLEKLIWEGKAFFKTYIAGPQKSTLNINNDRFIIITDITFSGYTQPDQDLIFPNMQLSIYGEKGFNHYIFRNKTQGFTPVFDGLSIKQISNTVINPMQKIDTYLLHTEQVGFSFIGNYDLLNLGTAVFQEINPAYQSPLDYGKEGLPGSVSVAISASDSTAVMNMQFMNRADNSGLAGNISSNQIQFPADLNNLPQAAIQGYCFAVVNYVEILGQPGNLEF